MSIYNTKVTERVGILLGTKNPEKALEFLMTLQKEQTPYYSQEVIEDLVIQGVAKLYNDQYLDFLWYSQRNAGTQSHTTLKAA